MDICGLRRWSLDEASVPLQGRMGVSLGVCGGLNDKHPLFVPGIEYLVPRWSRLGRLRSCGVAGGVMSLWALRVQDECHF